MKRLLTIAGCMCLYAVLATAQTTATPGQDMKTTPQTPATDPNATGPAAQQDPQTGTATSGQSSAEKQDKHSGKEVKVEGCIAEQGGKYVLTSKKYKDGVEILSSENLAAHVGHEVKVKGTWASSATTASSASAEHAAHSAAGTASDPSSGSSYPSSASSTTPGASSTSDTMQKPESDQPPSGSMKAIQASSVEMVSASCKK